MNICQQHTRRVGHKCSIDRLSANDHYGVGIMAWLQSKHFTYARAWLQRGFTGAVHAVFGHRFVWRARRIREAKLGDLGSLCWRSREHYVATAGQCTTPETLERIVAHHYRLAVGSAAKVAHVGRGFPGYGAITSYNFVCGYRYNGNGLGPW